MSAKHCPACGFVLETAAKRRSRAAHNRLFAICRAALANWPHDHEFRPHSEDHLRYWLECKAGHFVVTKTARIRSNDPEKVYALVSAFMRESDDEKLFLELDGELLIQKRVRSISDNEDISTAEFSKLQDAVCDIIEMETGVEAVRLLKETERAA